MRSLGVLVSVAALTAFLGAAQATETKIAALSLAPIPEATTVEIQLPVDDGSDDLRISLVLADHFSAILADLGYTIIAGDAELIFRFSLEVPTYAVRPDPSRHALLPHGSRRGSWLLPVAPTGGTIAAALAADDTETYRLRVSVARTKKPPLWTAYAERSVTGAEGPATYLEMANAVMALWGKSYSN